MQNLLLMSTTGELAIEWLTILLHMVNLLVLVAVLWLLLYKPIKKFIKKRQDTFKQAVDDNDAAKKQNEQLKEQYEQLIDEAKDQVASAGETARAQVDAQKKQIIDAAKVEAESIITVARDDAAKERKRMQNSVKTEAAMLATDIAAKILKRDINDKDNAAIIDESISNWKKHE